MKPSVTSAVCFMLLAAFAHAQPAPSDSAGDFKADVVISVGPKDTCQVTRSGTTPRPVACSAVVAYLINVLKLPKGSKYDMTTLPGGETSDIQRVMDALNAAGYRIPKVGFITEPEGHDH